MKYLDPKDPKYQAARSESMTQLARRAVVEHGADAMAAWSIVDSYTAHKLPPVPGMGTHARLAVRISQGKTPVEAAAREYLYRWNLALIPQARNAHIFGVPHTLGM